MQKLTTQPYTPQDGREFLGYMTHMMSEMARLQTEGRIPADQGVDHLLDFWRSVTAQIKTDVSKVGPADQQPITSSVPMTDAEYQRTWSMFDTLYPLLRILEMREAVDLTRTEGMTRVVNAIYQGTVG
jgi:hypothetical protein